MLEGLPTLPTGLGPRELCATAAGRRAVCRGCRGWSCQGCRWRGPSLRRWCGASWVLVWCCHLGPRTRSDCCWLLLASPRPATRPLASAWPGPPGQPPSVQGQFLFLSSWALLSWTRGAGGHRGQPGDQPGGQGGRGGQPRVVSCPRQAVSGQNFHSSLARWVAVWRGWRVAAGQGWPGPGLAARLSGPCRPSPGPDKVTALCEWWCRPSPAACQQHRPSKQRKLRRAAARWL